MRPRGRWKRKLRDRISRSWARSATASGSPSMPSYSRPSKVNVTGRPAPRNGAETRRAVTSADVERRRAVDADALRLEIRVEASHPELAPDAALLAAAERALREPDIVRVDPDISDAQPP